MCASDTSPSTRAEGVAAPERIGIATPAAINNPQMDASNTSIRSSPEPVERPAACRSVIGSLGAISAPTRAPEDVKLCFAVDARSLQLSQRHPSAMLYRTGHRDVCSIAPPTVTFARKELVHEDRHDSDDHRSCRLTLTSPALATTYGSVEPIASVDVIDISPLKAQRLDVRAAFAERLLQCGIVNQMIGVLVSNKQYHDDQWSQHAYRGWSRRVLRRNQPFVRLHDHRQRSERREPRRHQGPDRQPGLRDVAKQRIPARRRQRDELRLPRQLRGAELRNASADEAIGGTLRNRRPDRSRTVRHRHQRLHAVRPRVSVTAVRSWTTSGSSRGTGGSRRVRGRIHADRQEAFRHCSRAARRFRQRLDPEPARRGVPRADSCRKPSRAAEASSGPLDSREMRSACSIDETKEARIKGFAIRWLSSGVRPNLHRATEEGRV